MLKVNIEDRYKPSEEIRVDEKPYIAYFKSLEKTFDLSSIQGVCDVGCATGALIKYIKISYPQQKVAGIEYFPWQKEAADKLIRDDILIHDMRVPLQGCDKYEIVNCSEVGEHIDPGYCFIMMENLKTLCKKYLIMTWSSSGGMFDREHDPNLQHLNPLPYVDYVATVESYGFFKNMDLTRRFLFEARHCGDFSFWWLDSLVVFERKDPPR